MLNETGLLVGRFQPFHNGHLYLIKKALGHVDSLIIGIGSANVFDKNNPFTFEERKEMIKKVIKYEKLDNRIKDIVPLNDYYDDKLWYENSIKLVDGINVVIGNNEWVNKIFGKFGYPILRVPYFKRYLYEGEKIRKLMGESAPSTAGFGEVKWKDRVPKYIVPLLNGYIVKLKNMKYKYQHLAVGGTFDHIHLGHKHLIDTAFENGQIVSIGIATETLYKNKLLNESIEDYETRKRNLIKYLTTKNYLSRAQIFPLSDVYGTTKTDGTIEALVVSKATYPGYLKINQYRKKRNLPELDVIIAETVLGNDKKIISSERIRKGEIDREGNNIQYLISKSNFQKRKKALIMPENLRQELRRPLGIVIKGKEFELEKTAKKTIQFINEMKPVMVIAVGDIITQSLLVNGYIPDIAIVDFRSRRKDMMDTSNNFDAAAQESYANKPGTINMKTFKKIKKLIDTFMKIKVKLQLVIKGEEDLLVLPAILLAPLNSVVVYGQMDMGVVIADVTEDNKNKIRDLIKKFI